MNEPKTPHLSEHIRQRTQEWFRKAEHELAYLGVSPLNIDDSPTDLVYPGPFPTSVSIAEANSAIEKARRIYRFVLKKAKDLGYDDA